ncbi:MAG: AsmA family protein, partial [Alphaproteobacteria bacterium]|nr:AsmA family protein [Alphaproteobacteria bacterium]
MRIAKILSIAVAVVVVLLVAGAIVLMNLDFNKYKQEISAEAKKATGRDLVIGGDLGLDLFTFSPGLAVDDVRFANAPWGSRPEMATIKRFEVKVAILPLLAGTLEIKRIELEGADILIERGKDGRGNYEFDTAAKPEPGEDKPSTATFDGIPDIAIEALTIEDARLTYLDDASGQSIVVAIQTMTLSGGTGEPLDIDLQGAYNESPFTVKGQLGDLAQLTKPSEPWPVAVTAAVAGATLELKGAIANPAAASGLDLALAITGANLSEFGKLAQASVPALGPYSMGAKIAGDAEKTINVKDIAIKMGNSALTGQASLQMAQRPTLTAAFASDLIDLADFTKEPAGGTDTAGPASGASTASGASGDKRLFPADPLPVDGLKAADATVDLTVKKLVAQGIPVGNIQVKLALKNGDLKVKPNAELSNGTVSGLVRLNARPATPQLDVKIAGKKIDAGKLLADMAITDLLQGVISADVDVTGRGKSVRAIMAGLNGKTNVLMGKGRMKSDALNIYVGEVMTVLTQAVFGKKSEYTVINCFVNQFDIKNGIADSKIMLFDTEYATVTGKGDINLATEQIDYELDPRPKSITVNTAVPVEITGPLADPSVSLNKLAAAAKVGGLIGTVVFPPA